MISKLPAWIRPIIAVLGNLLIAYVMYFIARIAFLAENYSLFADNLSTPHLMEMLRGGVVFDTSSAIWSRGCSSSEHDEGRRVKRQKNKRPLTQRHTI